MAPGMLQERNLNGRDGMDVRDPEGGATQALTSLVFPTYNPGPQIEHTWQEVRQFLNDHPGAWEILFVCDGCTDGTPARLEELLAGEHQPVQIINYAPNRGKGYAVRRGLEAAKGAWRIFTDIDLAYSLGDVQRLAQVLQSGAEVAIASRLHPDSRVILPPALHGYAYRRHLQSWLFTQLAHHLLPLRQGDTQAGLKGMSAAAARRLLPHLHCDGFGFDCELLTACAHFGVDVTEVPVWVRYENTASTTGVGAMRKMFRELLRIRRDWRSMAHPVAVPVQPVDTVQREAA
jgi:dolichyl-phosphate beta-glucosyltransferase